MNRATVFFAIFVLVQAASARAQASDGDSPPEANPAQPPAERVETEISLPAPAQVALPVEQPAPVPVPCKFWMLPAPPAPVTELGQQEGQVATPLALAPLCSSGHTCLILRQQDGEVAAPLAPVPSCLPGQPCFVLECPPTRVPLGAAVPPGASAAGSDERPVPTISAEERARVRSLARSRYRMVIGARPALQPESQTLRSKYNDSVLGVEFYAGMRRHFRPRTGMELTAGGTFLSAQMGCSDTQSSNYCSPSGNATAISTGFVEGSLILGPYGRFYIAPLLWAGFRGYSSATAFAGNREVAFPSSGPVAGAGLRSGAFVGSTDSFDLHAEVRVAGGQERFLLITTGVGFAP